MTTKLLVIAVVIGVVFVLVHIIFVNQNTIFIGEKQYFIPKNRHLAKQTKEDKTYILMGSGLQEPWRFDHWIDDHWSEGKYGVILILIFQNDTLQRASAEIDIIHHFRYENSPYELPIIFDLKGTANLENDVVKKLKLFDRSNVEDIEFRLKKINLKNIEEINLERAIQLFKIGSTVL